MRRLVVALILAAVGLSACTKDTPVKPAAAGVTAFKDLGNGHKRGALTFAQTPPVGGDHSPAWLKCGVYTESLPNENVVHSLEHGAVWLTYQDTLPAADIAKLVTLDDLKPDYVIVSPYPGQPSPVTATAWGLQLNVTSANDPRLASFVRTYAGGAQGGEGGADCRGQGFTPEQARKFNSGG